ncbi:sugar transferase [Enterococcus wangshanyuanii]|uniref:Multidrug MFS transporter n=1 Tax=Enterococcus wangshanyuanii TaxID=2005703 RepID=A0ABQ1PR99_9ENTE|nr:sugar transferase [Enterococcus wangshanyuanii]GGD01227.1 multidrug MFS transporter [Enterococcus wangshanyuanii]
MEEKIVSVGGSMQKKKQTTQSDKKISVSVVASQSIRFRVFKRTIDILGSLCGLILLSPVFLIVAFLIRKEDPNGPVVFSQERIGKKGNRFTMYKFRSMCTDAEEKFHDLVEQNEIEGAMFKIKNDPRVTKIGKKIRKTSIDELPQLVNVLKGDMSLVGPRPPLEREVSQYTQRDLQRLNVKPGCTGLWQVRGRNDVHFDEMVDFDLEYIENQSIWNDLKIMFQTVIVMFFSRGAY